MNIYWVDAGNQEVLVDIVDIDLGRYETQRIFNFVVAETRGKAKALFARVHWREIEDIRDVKHCWCVAKNVEDAYSTPGIVWEMREDYSVWDLLEKHPLYSKTYKDIFFMEDEDEI